METRETFLARLRPILPPSELRSVELAYTLAKYHHRAQKRMEVDPSGEQVRYFEHCRRVAILLIDVGGVKDWVSVCAGLLHDIIEDTEFTPDLLEHAFGPEVARTVLLLTKGEDKDAYFSNLVQSRNERAVVIKLCDRIDNMNSLPADDPDFAKRKLVETWHKLVLPLKSVKFEHSPMSDARCRLFEQLIQVIDTARDKFGV